MINEIKVSVMFSWNIIYAQVFSFLKIYLFFLTALVLLASRCFVNLQNCLFLRENGFISILLR